MLVLVMTAFRRRRWLSVLEKVGAMIIGWSLGRRIGRAEEVPWPILVLDVLQIMLGGLNGV